MPQSSSRNQPKERPPSHVSTWVFALLQFVRRKLLYLKISFQGSHGDCQRPASEPRSSPQKSIDAITLPKILQLHMYNYVSCSSHLYSWRRYLRILRICMYSYVSYYIMCCVKRCKLHTYIVIISHYLIFLFSLMPIALYFLITSKLIVTDDPLMLIKLIGNYSVTLFCSLTTHFVIVNPLLYFLITRKNPFIFMHGMRDALFTAFASCSRWVPYFAEIIRFYYRNIFPKWMYFQIHFWGKQMSFFKVYSIV